MKENHFQKLTSLRPDEKNITPKIGGSTQCCSEIAKQQFLGFTLCSSSKLLGKSVILRHRPLGCFSSCCLSWCLNKQKSNRTLWYKSYSWNMDILQIILHLLSAVNYKYACLNVCRFHCYHIPLTSVFIIICVSSTGVLAVSCRCTTPLVTRTPTSLMSWTAAATPSMSCLSVG